MTSYTSDTSREAREVQLELLRRMAPEERFRKACAMSRRCRKMAMEAIRRRYPRISGEEMRLRFIELVYGRELADAVRRHEKADRAKGDRR